MDNINQQMMNDADENSPTNFIRRQQEELNQVAQVVPFGMTEEMLPQEFISPSTPDGSLEPTDSTFTGWFGSGIGRTFPINGVDTVICSGVVNSGTLAAGMGQGGGLYAGGGTFTADEDGATVLANNNFADLRAYTFTDGTTVFGGLYALLNGAVRWVRTLAQSLAGDSALLLQSISPSGKASEVTMAAGDGAVDDIAEISVKKSTADVYSVELNSLYNDIDTHINGTSGTTPIITVDAGTERVGVNQNSPATALDVAGTVTSDGLTVAGATDLSAGTTTINSGSGNFDTIINGDTTEVARVDASADSLGIGTATPSAKLEIVGTMKQSGGAMTVNAPLDDYDTAIGGADRNVLTIDAGLNSAIVTKLNLPNGANLTISSGAITVTHSAHLVDTEGAAATDDLDTINGGSNGDILILSTLNAGRDVTVKDGTGNLRLAGDFLMDTAQDTITLRYSSNLSAWLELARSNNA